MSQMPSSDTLDRLAAVVGRRQCHPRRLGNGRLYAEWRQIWSGRSPLVLRPGSTERSRRSSPSPTRRHGNRPQAGNTGLCGGQIPTESGHEVLLSVDRMNRILDVDPADNTITVEPAPS